MTTGKIYLWHWSWGIREPINHLALFLQVQPQFTGRYRSLGEGSLAAAFLLMPCEHGLWVRNTTLLFSSATSDDKIVFPTYSPKSLIHQGVEPKCLASCHSLDKTVRSKQDRGGRKARNSFITSPNEEMSHCTGFCFACLFFLATLPKPLSLVLIDSLETFIFAINSLFIVWQALDKTARMLLNQFLPKWFLLLISHSTAT